MKGFKDNIKDNLGMNENVALGGEVNTVSVRAGDVNGSLEQSRSKIRSLLDRSSVDEIKFSQSIKKVVCLSDDRLISSLNTLVTSQMIHGVEEQMKSFTLQLQLLNAFMKDIQKLEVLESNMERSWVLEANDTIEEAQQVIDKMEKKAKQQEKYMCRGLSKLLGTSNWMLRRKLKKYMRLVCTRISGLLEIKERYGVKFIRTEPPHHSHLRRNAAPPQQQLSDRNQLTTDDTNSSPSVQLVRVLNWLNKLSADTCRQLGGHVESLRKELEGMLQHFNDVRATEDFAINLRNACLEQLKNLANEADKEDSDRSPSELLSKIIIPIEHAVRCMRVYSIEERGDSCSVVGFEEDTDDLVSRLVHEDQHSIICIKGMKGIGKTTLAKKVFYQKSIVERFKVTHWIPMPTTVSSAKIHLRMVGIQVLKETEPKWRMGNDYWISGMRDRLKEERSLLVFDNVTSKEAWDLIKPAFSGISNGSKVVLITSNRAIALDAGENSIRYPVRLRTKEESWDLFTQMVQYSPDDDQNVVVNAKKLVESVGGLPLAIIRVGYQLWGKKLTLENLSKVVKRISKEQNQLPWFDNMAVNVDVKVDPILSKCFSYFQHFPRHFEVPVRRITASWVAQGLEKLPPSRDESQIQTSTDGEGTPESFAYNNLIQLVSRNMIQPLQIKPNGKFRTCRLPLPVHDILLQSRSLPTTNLDWQHMFPLDGNDASLQPDAIQNDQGPDCLLFFDTRTEIRPGESIDEILYRGISCSLFLQLHVLDLEGVFRPQIPNAIGQLKQLEYLGLRWTYLMTVPLSIFDLAKLKTLDLKHTHVSSLPSSLWELKELRHLYLNQNCRVLPPTAIFRRKLLGVMVKTPSRMRRLQILSGIFVDKANLVLVRGLKFPHLRKLRLAFQLTQQEQTSLQKWIGTLSNLETLKLRSTNEKRQPEDLNLDISQLKNLCSLHLFGKLADPRIIENLPQRLTHLTLSASGISEDPMRVLEELPNLRSLSLLSGSYTGKKLVCSNNGFPRLLVLKLWNLALLENLEVTDAMPNLRKFDSRSCRILKIPPRLKHLTTSHEAEEQSASAVEGQSVEGQR